ncbi:MAG: glycosyltransferase family 25 protein [Chitinophagaceae bacterium]|jgi:glycosyl transferase family 25|nr:glycosyltransferase family 25 protein [Chitinophagaceae bacterium]
MNSAFSFLNQFYDKIYVLSLPRLQNRVDYINTTLHGLDFEFFWGIDKENTSLDQLKDELLFSPESYRQFYKKPQQMHIGMLCCSLGHLQIYEHIVANQIGKTLILEDDAIPQFGNLEFFPEIIKELPDDWELFYLGYEKNEILGKKEKIKKRYYQLFNMHAQLKLSRKMYNRFYPEEIGKYMSVAGFHDCTHAYCVTLEGAKKLINHQKPVSFNADNLLSYLVLTNKINGYISKQKLFNQLSAFNHPSYSLTSN